MPQPYNIVPHVVVTFNHKIISLLFHNWNFATVINSNVNKYLCFPIMVLGDPCERVIRDAQVKNCYLIAQKRAGAISRSVEEEERLQI